MSLYWPLCIFKWQGLHTGICFLFSVDIKAKKPVGFVPPFLMCFTWCISTFLSSPHIQQGSKGLICDLRLQLTTAKGSTGLVVDFVNNLVVFLKLSNVNKLTDLSLSSSTVLKYLPNLANAWALLGKLSFLASVLAHEWWMNRLTIEWKEYLLSTKP